MTVLLILSAIFGWLTVCAIFAGAQRLDITARLKTAEDFRRFERVSDFEHIARLALLRDPRDLYDWEVSWCSAV